MTNAVNISTSPKLLHKILIESRWLMVGLVAIILSLSLWSFDREDPSWSHAFVTSYNNTLGKSGAIVADILYYAFGISAWWVVVLLIFIAWRGLERFPFLNRFVRNTKPLPLILGFIIVVCSSAALENLRFHSYEVELPFVSGGILGMLCANFLKELIGYTGATVFFLFGLIMGWQIFSGMSWILLSERIGAFLENTFNFYRRGFEHWQDGRIGRETTLDREEKLRQERLRVQDLEPIIISTTPQPVELASKVVKQLEKEKRHKEQLQQDLNTPKQQQLFDFSLPEISLAPAPNVHPSTTSANSKINSDSSTFAAPPSSNCPTSNEIMPVASKSELPSVTLLDPPPSHLEVPSVESLEFTSRLIERKLAEFRVEVKVISASPGPVVTRYEIEPAVGVKGSQIINLERDLARALSLVSVRIVDTVPGKPYMALELPNNVRHIVKLIEIIGSRVYQENYSHLTICLGKDISGNPVIADLAKMPHLLVAGTTGSGKSVGVNAMILSLLFKATPEQVRMIMIDPKMLEFSIYEGIPHLLTPVVTDMKQAASALNWCVGEMDKRYRLMSALGVRNIAGLNEKIRQARRNNLHITNPFSLTPENPEPLASLPYIVVVIDELADLMMVVGKKIEELIARLAQKARAAGIHLVLATQRPSVDVITGLIKANIPSRLSFQVSSKIDSRTIIDQMGAESLLGQGDMLFLPSGSGYPQRVHGAYVSDDEVHRIVNFLKERSAPDYIDDVLSTGVEGISEVKSDNDGEKDLLYDKAVEIVIQSRRASTSLVQRHLRVGYNRAARLVESMEEAGIVSRADERGVREVIAKPLADD